MRHPLTSTTGDTTAVTTMDVVAATATLADSVPLSASMKWKEETIVDGEES